MYWTWPWQWFGGIFGVLLSILIIVIIIRVIIRIVTGERYPYRHFHRYYYDEGKSNALNILHERYAKGEITKEQYKSMKKDLESR